MYVIDKPSLNRKTSEENLSVVDRWIADTADKLNLTISALEESMQNLPTGGGEGVSIDTTEIDKQIAQVKDALSTLQDTVARTNTAINTVKGSVTTLSTAVAASQSDINTMLATQTSEIARVDGIESDVRDLWTSTDVLSADISAVDEQVISLLGLTATNTSAIEEIRGDVAENATGITGLDGRVTLVETYGSRITEAESDILSLEDEVSGLTSSTGNLSDVAIGLDIRLTNAESVLSSQDEQITTINSGLSGKVDKVDGKGLSTEDFTTEEKQKLAGLSANPVADEVTRLAVGKTVSETYSSGKTVTITFTDTKATETVVENGVTTTHTYTVASNGTITRS